MSFSLCEPAWPGGKALGWKAEGRKTKKKVTFPPLCNALKIRNDDDDDDDVDDNDDDS